MAFFKLGCNWGAGKPDFYELLKKHSIVICADKKMCPWDYVAITKGYDVVAVAQIVEERQPCTRIEDLKNVFSSYEIDYKDWNYIAKAQIWDIPEVDRFQYKLQQGICEIQNQLIIEKISSLVRSAMIDMQTKSMEILLKKNHNLILTGAPGTGKTYLAKKIAKAMGCSDDEIGFVQFHPSYDYTDFVEGLRPVQDNNGIVGFERIDGVFKDFCKKAFKNLLDSDEKNNNYIIDIVFDDVYEALFDEICLGTITGYETEKHGKLNVFIDGKGKITFQQGASQYTKSVKKEYLKILFEKFYDKTSEEILQCKRKDLEKVIEESDLKANTIDYVQYRWTLSELVKKYKGIDVKSYSNKKVEKKSFVFIIDEINRGEISKIFGELFFSIDPGYRGETGKVKTQYQNLIEDGDVFNCGFFVPENVYIIGTMNDIDRSVESMDFAFRRRFAFKEVTAEMSQSMFDNDEVWKMPDGNIVKPDITVLKNRMNNLNKAIDNIEGLSSAYHIGGSYFLKLKNYGNNFDDLWNYHIEGLLREYLRGNPDVDEKIMALKEAYKNDQDVTSENNG